MVLWQNDHHIHILNCLVSQAANRLSIPTSFQKILVKYYNDTMYILYIYWLVIQASHYIISFDQQILCIGTQIDSFFLNPELRVFIYVSLAPKKPYPSQPGRESLEATWDQDWVTLSPITFPSLKRIHCSKSQKDHETN